MNESGNHSEQLRSLRSAQPAHLEKAVSTFASLGWAFCGNWHHDSTVKILDSIGRRGTPADIDAAVTRMWNDEGKFWLKLAPAPIRRWGNAHVPFKNVLWRRVELMEKAIELHFAGEYAASVPILMSQIDGLTRDLVGQTFFQNVTAKNQENFIDDESLAGMPGNLVEVRRVFSTPSYETTRSGSISRHGVMHGRELDYDTLENSTKCIVLLAALAEYLPPFADTKGFEALDVHSSTVAGLLGVDDEGRLLDDRDVREFQGFAFYLDIAYMNAQLTPTLHTFDLDYQVRSLAAKHRLDRKQIFYFHDAAGWWLFYKLPSGHFLVLAERPNTSTESRNPDAWRWDAHEDPSVAPWHNARGWQSDDVYPRTSNWEPLQIGT